MIFGNSYSYSILTNVFLRDLFYFQLHPILLKTWAIVLGQRFIILTHPEGLYSKGNCKNLNHNSYSSKSVTLFWGCYFTSTRVLLFFTIGDSFEPQGSSAMANKGCMSLRFECLHFHETEWAFWAAGDLFWVYRQPKHELLFSHVFPIQYLCGDSRSKRYSSLFYFIFICIFSLFLPVTIYVSEVCHPLVSPASLSFLNLIGMAFILYKRAFPFYIFIQIIGSLYCMQS